jgi:hypothetical protein
MMRATQNEASPGWIVAEVSANSNVVGPRRARVIELRQYTTRHPDAQEARLRRRDHRIALALMIGSSLVSLLALLGIWVLFRRVI